MGALAFTLANRPGRVDELNNLIGNAEALVRIAATARNGQALLEEYVADWSNAHEAREREREFEEIDNSLGWALFAEKEAELPPAKRRRKGDAALRREVQEYLDQMLPIVQSNFGPRKQDPHGRTVEELKAAQLRASDRLTAAQAELGTSPRHLVEHAMRTASSRLQEVEVELRQARRAVMDPAEKQEHDELVSDLTRQHDERVSSLTRQRDELSSDLARVRGEPGALQGLSSVQLRELRNRVADSLGRIDNAVAAAVDQETECVICRDCTRDVAFAPCGHYVACYSCAIEQERCPICRADVEGQRVLRIYQA